MNTTTLEVNWRTSLKKNKMGAIRSRGDIPAIIYGKGTEPTPISLNRVQLEKLYRGDHGRNILLNLVIKGEKETKEINVISYQFDVDPVSGELIHVDFLTVHEGEKVDVKIPITFTGTSPGVRMGGIIMQKIKLLKISSIPKNIPSALVLDLSTMQLGDITFVRDLDTKDKFDIRNSEREMVVKIHQPRGAAEDEEEEEEEGEEGTEDTEGAKDTEAKTDDAPAEG